MDDLIKNNEIDESANDIINNQEDAVENSFESVEHIAEEKAAFSEPSLNQNGTGTVYKPVNYTPAEPISDYKPMSRGLKVFSLVIAAIILLTGTSLTGYFLGRNSMKTSGRKVASIDLAARPTDTEQMTEAQVYESLNKSIVGIIVYNSSGKISQATGIVYSKDGYIVTNDHIYSEVPAAEFMICTYDGKEYSAEYIAGDKVSDLAILKVNDAKLTPATFGNSDEVFCGEHVVAIGRTNDARDASSITKGVISAVNIRVQTTSAYSARLIQTDSAINPGSSGGALVNMYGQVIGVTSSKLASVEYDAVGYAIPTTVMKRIAGELIKDKKVVSRAKLGITYSAVDSVTAEIKGLEYTGLLIDSVAEESGLYGKAEKGDIITHINGIKITNDTIVLDIIEQSFAGDKISVTIVTNGGKTKTFDVELKANVSESSYSTNEVIGDNSDGNDSSKNDGTFNFPFGE